MPPDQLGIGNQCPCFSKIGVPKGILFIFGVKRGKSILDIEVYYVDMFDNQLQICFTYSNISWLMLPDQPGEA